MLDHLNRVAATTPNRSGTHSVWMMLPDENCQKCGLHQSCRSPYMQASGYNKPAVMVVGEAPGEEEDREGTPFIGRSGKLLRDALSGAGFVKVLYSNVVRCRPPGNKISKRAIDCCAPNIIEEIAHYNPRIVLLLGNVPLNAVLHETGITSWHGVVVRKLDRIYVPLFHPAYVLRNIAVMDSWLKGLCDAADLLNDDSYEAIDVEYTYPNTVADVRRMCNILMSCDGVIAYDTETSDLDGHRPTSKMLAVSFANGKYAWSIPIDYDDMWGNDRTDVIHSIGNVLQHKRIVGHHIKFDQRMTNALLGIKFTAESDTMLISHLLDSRRGIHGLKRLAGLYVGMYGYDRELAEYTSVHKEADPYRGGSYSELPLEILLPYSAMDAHATLMVYNALVGDLTEQQSALLDELMMPASSVLAMVEDHGIVLDMHIADRYSRIYATAQAEIYNKISNDRFVRAMVHEEQQRADRAVITAMAPGIPSDIGNRFSVHSGYILDGNTGRKRKRKVYGFNPNSVTQVGKLIYGRYRLKATLLTDGGAPSVKKEALKPYVERFPIVRDILYYRLLTKMLGTYLLPASRGMWGSKGRARCTYNQHGTVTGRLSSSDPNMQNIPTPEKEPGTLLETLPIKNLFTSSRGLLVSADYAGMELRVFASLANCGAMLEIHSSGADFHTMVASMVSGIPYDKVDKPTRYIYKWTNWTLLYGGDEHTLSGMYGISLSEAAKTVSLYHKRFPEVNEYMEECVQFAKEHGYIQSPFGRRERLPYILDSDHSKRAKSRRSAVNMPVQSGASDITLMAMVIIDRILKDDAVDAAIVNTVHDSIVLDIRPQDLDEVADVCRDIMENITEWAKVYMPRIDMSWLRCPLKADIDYGTHYGAMDPYVWE